MLTAPSESEMEGWLYTLQDVLRLNVPVAPMPSWTASPAVASTTSRVAQRAFLEHHSVALLITEAASGEDYEKCLIYRRFKELLSQIDLAVAEENFEACIQLREEKKRLEEANPEIVDKRDELLVSGFLQQQQQQSAETSASKSPPPSASLRSSPSVLSRGASSLATSPSPTPAQQQAALRSRLFKSDSRSKLTEAAPGSTHRLSKSIERGAVYEQAQASKAPSQRTRMPAEPTHAQRKTSTWGGGAGGRFTLAEAAARKASSSSSSDDDEEPGESVLKLRSTETASSTTSSSSIATKKVKLKKKVRRAADDADAAKIAQQKKQPPNTSKTKKSKKSSAFV